MGVVDEDVGAAAERRRWSPDAATPATSLRPTAPSAPEMQMLVPASDTPRHRTGAPRHRAGARSPPTPYTRWDAERAGQRAPRSHRGQSGDRARRLPTGAPARRMRVRARAARPQIPERAQDPHLLRALLPHGAHAP